jgi:hypothetical protein
VVLQFRRRGAGATAGKRRSGADGAATARRAHVCGPDLGCAGPIWAMRVAAVCSQWQLWAAPVRPGPAARRRGGLDASRACCAAVACGGAPAGFPAVVVVVVVVDHGTTTSTTRCCYDSSVILGCVLLAGWVCGVRQFGRKSCPACVGAGDDGAFGRRFPPWRRRCEAPASPPPSGCCLRVKTLIRHAELAMVASLMSLLC